MSYLIGSSATYSTWGMIRSAYGSNNPSTSGQNNFTLLAGPGTFAGFKSDDTGKGLIRFPRSSLFFVNAGLDFGHAAGNPVLSIFFMQQIDNKDTDQLIGSAVVSNLTFNITSAAFTTGQFLPPTTSPSLVISIQKLLPF